MKYFSIADIESFSSLKAHTIRIWEHRYKILKPGRNKGNSRVYNLEDVAHILNLSVLNNAGYKISRLARMDTEQVGQYLLSLHDEKDKFRVELNKLILTMLSENTEKFDAILDDCISYGGIDHTIKHIILPFLERVRLFSCKNCEAEIDFAVTSIRKKLLLGIEKANVESKRNSVALLFLPEGEYYDLLLLYFNYLIKSFGFRVLYMGSNISTTKLKAVAHSKQPDFLLTYISATNKKGLTEIIEYVNEESSPKCFITGFENIIPQKLELPKLKFLHYGEAPHTLPELA